MLGDIVGSPELAGHDVSRRSSFTLMFLRPPTMVKILGLPLICLAMFSVAGGHWALLQTVAWGQMLWSYSQESGSVMDGAKMTFSGSYPCAMCKKVAAAKQQEEKNPATVKLDKKAENFLPVILLSVELPAPQDFLYPDTEKLAADTRRDRPPVPFPIALS